MINVLHISSPITWRGGERQIANLLLALQYKKANQILLCPANTPLADFCKEKGFKHITLHKANGFSIRWAKKIKEICEENNITHIHVHDSKAQTYAVTAATLYKNEPVIIVSRRVIFPIKDKWLTQFKYTHPKIGTIICISKSVESVLLENIPAAKTTIVASCINTKKYRDSNKPATLKKEYSLTKDSILIGYVAALSKEKDHGTFIETAEQILKKNDKAHFFIIGEGKERSAIERKIEKHKLQDKIKLTGFIRDIDAVIPQLDLLLFTSTSEGLGSSILDFFLARIPVVSTRCGGVEEIITHNKTGLLSNVGDVKDLAKNSLLLLSDSGLKEKITENAYEYIVNNHSLEQLGEKTYDIYIKNINSKLKTANHKHESKKLTAIIPTYNEVLHIEEAMNSVAFADEIIVIDSYSTDETVVLAEKNNAKVLLRKFDDFSTQKNFAIAEASNDWIFILDADERLTDTLKNEIIQTLQNNTLKDAYWVYRQNYFANKRIYFSGWQNDKVMRLFNRKYAKYDGKMVHEEIKNLGSSGYLRGKMLHFSSDNEEIFKSKIVKYAKLKAQELYLDKVKPNFFHYYIKPCYRFVYHYLFKFGFLDGKTGYTIACINAYGIKERYQELKRLYKKQE